LKLLLKSSDKPTTASDFALRTPTLSRSHPGVTAAVNSMEKDIAPNMVIVAHARPAGPLSPIANDYAAVEPIKDVKAAISIRPLPKLNMLNPDIDSVELSIAKVFTSGSKEKITGTCSRETCRDSIGVSLETWDLFQGPTGNDYADQHFAQHSHKWISGTERHSMGSIVCS
jgi:hypothetical protein